MPAIYDFMYYLLSHAPTVNILFHLLVCILFFVISVTHCTSSCNIVGDLHGDLAQARCALETAGVLSSDGQDLWTGGETV